VVVSRHIGSLLGKGARGLVWGLFRDPSFLYREATMGALARVLAVFCLLVLGAHFLRGGSLLLVTICVGLCALVFVPWRWAIGIVQVVLVLGAAEWLFTIYGMVGERQAEERAWARAAAILLTVGALHLVAAVLLGRRKVLGNGTGT
jgi:hypothetical protein